MAVAAQAIWPETMPWSRMYEWRLQLAMISTVPGWNTELPLVVQELQFTRLQFKVSPYRSSLDTRRGREREREGGRRGFRRRWASIRPTIIDMRALSARLSNCQNVYHWAIIRFELLAKLR